MICKPPSVWGRLNAFQKVMLHWRCLHPYNAAHTYKLAGPLRPEGLRDAVRETYLNHDMGIAHLSPDGRSYRHEVDFAPEVDLVWGGTEAEGRLPEHVSLELNRSFERPTCRPFRFSAVDAGPSSHYVTVAYDHWVADSVAARLLLRNVLGRYLRLPIQEDGQFLELYPGTYREIFHHRLHGPKLAMAAARTMHRWSRDRKAWHVPCWPSTQWAVRYDLHRTSPGTVPRLRQYARSHSATVHDVMLAALGRAMAQFMRSQGRSQDLALGSIVDTRPLAEQDLCHTMGTFLGFYQVRGKLANLASLDEATRHIAAITGLIKARHRYLDSLVNMNCMNVLWPWLPESVKPCFVQRVSPLTAGVSNVLVREPWMDQNREVILEYSRAASTGPMLPLVLTPTTLGEEMNIGVTYRVAGFSQARIDGIMAVFIDQIERPERAAHSSRRRRRVTASLPNAA